MTTFLNSHYDSMLTSSNLESYVETCLVPALVDADACRYDVESKTFIPLRFEEVTEMIMHPIVQLLRAKQDNENAKCAARSDRSVVEANATQHPVIKTCKNTQGPMKTLSVLEAKKKPRKNVPIKSPRINQKSWAAKDGKRPLRINLQHDAYKQDRARTLSRVYDIPFHDCAFYPCKWKQRKAFFNVALTDEFYIWLQRAQATTSFVVSKP